MTGEDRGSVVVERDGPVATLRLNEPQTLNALSASIKAGLAAAVDEVLDDPEIRVIVLTGTGRAFCAGGDIRAMSDRQPVSVRTRMKAAHDWLYPLLATEKPIVAAVNGVAAGAGFSLALAGDIIVASEDARFKAGFPGLGAAPDLGLAYTLPRAIGLNRAKDILMTNRDVPAAEALAIGLVARLVPAADVMATALTLARELAEAPGVSLGLTKLLLRRGAELSLDAFLGVEGLSQAVAFASDDFAEGVAAFQGKRKATFQGR
jgi:2-(1,2-epoxy-1,2-dihydrophenyl)acetyl-CoA isomerase